MNGANQTSSSEIHAEHQNKGFFREEIKNISIVFTVITAVLFATGWAYENVLAEQFSFNSYELIPSTSTLIASGFTVIVFKFFANLTVLVALGACVGPGVIGAGLLMKKHPEIRALFHIPGARMAIFGATPLLIGLWFVAVAEQAKQEAKEIRATSGSDVQTLRINSQKEPLKGRVIRNWEGKLAFLQLPESKVFLVPDTRIVELTADTSKP